MLKEFNIKADKNAFSRSTYLDMPCQRRHKVCGLYTVETVLSIVLGKDPHRLGCGHKREAVSCCFQEFSEILQKDSVGYY